MSGERKFIVEESDLEDKRKQEEFKQEFMKLRKSKQTTDEEKMYMDLVDRKNKGGQ